MLTFDKDWLDFLRDLIPKGVRISYTEWNDGGPVRPKETGVLDCIDEQGLFHCDLDDGRRLVASIDEGSFHVTLQEQDGAYKAKKYRQLMEKNRDLVNSSEQHQDLRSEVLYMLNLERMPRWALDILYPPIRSVLAQPGKPAEIVEVGGSAASIREQLHCTELACVADCSSLGRFHIYYDPDARKKGLPFNRQLRGDNYHGPILINGMYSTGRALTEAEAGKLLQLLNRPAAMREAPARGRNRKKKGGEVR